jgi:prepilin-type N-terminal cleavage/methylation domain-containing protein
MRQKENFGFTPLENWGNIPTQDLHKINSGRSGEKKSRFLTGFTLIELLIVVAIIAILAAIAIPNYFAAQVRAKVGRVMSEHRTIGTALEAYYVDNTAYPYPEYVRDAPLYVPDSVTTPIAYIKGNDIYDPFRQGIYGLTPWMIHYTRYRYVCFEERHKGAPASYEATYGYYGKWRVSSAGPDRSAGPFSWGPPPGYASGLDLWYFWLPYDPSNGVMSTGDVMRSQSMRWKD